MIIGIILRLYEENKGKRKEMGWGKSGGVFHGLEIVDCPAATGILFAVGMFNKAWTELPRNGLKSGRFHKVDFQKMIGEMIGTVIILRVYSSWWDRARFHSVGGTCQNSRSVGEHGKNLDWKRRAKAHPCSKLKRSQIQNESIFVSLTPIKSSLSVRRVK
jgi:hypothetical protein